MNLDFAASDVAAAAPTPSEGWLQKEEREPMWSKSWRQVGGVNWTKLFSPKMLEGAYA